METDQAGNEALAWLERVYQHGVSGVYHQLRVHSVHSSWAAAVLCCCSPRSHGHSVPAPCLPGPSCPEIHSQGVSFQLLQGRDQAGGPHGAGLCRGRRLAGTRPGMALCCKSDESPPHAPCPESVWLCCLQLPVVNLVTASCKAVFGNNTTSNDNSSRASSGAQLDPGASASYLYYM